jgi:cyclase
MIEEVVPGIYTSDHPVAEGKNGIVFGDRAVLAIDTGNSPEDGQAMVEFIRAQGREPDWLLLTHGHGDHVGGGPAFGNCLVFAHHDASDTIRRTVLRERREGSADTADAGVPWPAVTFAGDLRLDLGGRHVRCFHTPGHSADSICAYVEEDRVLFGGDTAVTGIVPAFGDGDSRLLEATLRRLAGVPAEILVAGHGPVLRGRNRIHDWLLWMAGYLAAVRDYVERAHQSGVTEEAIVQSLDFGRFIGGRLPPERHGMLRRHQNTARAMLRELART